MLATPCAGIIRVVYRQTIVLFDEGCWTETTAYKSSYPRHTFLLYFQGIEDMQASL
jgi:hypothetical protein